MLGRGQKWYIMIHFMEIKPRHALFLKRPAGRRAFCAIPDFPRERRRGGPRGRPPMFGMILFHAEGFDQGASSFFSGEKGTKTPPGVGSDFYRGPILDTCASLSGAGGVTTDSATAPLPLFLQNQDGLTGWTKRARLIAQGIIAAGETRRAADRRPYQAILAMRNTMATAARRPNLSLRNQTGPLKPRRGRPRVRPSMFGMILFHAEGFDQGAQRFQKAVPGSEDLDVSL